MSSSLDSLWQTILTARRRVFVSYHHGGDEIFYDRFTEVFGNGYEAIYDNSPERAIDSDNSDYVIRRLREGFIQGSSCTIVLVGRNTWGRRYVDWEIKATLDERHSLVAVELPTAQGTVLTGTRMPDRLRDNIKTGYAVWATWQTLLASPAHLRTCIEIANDRSRSLIRNDRPRRLQSATLI
jgi:hypothetical protein